MGVLRSISGNGAARFRLKVKQESQITTRAGKSAETVIKQLASEELQYEKEKMQEWKKNVMQEVGCKLQIIKQMYEGSIEAQKRNFQVELENI